MKIKFLHGFRGRETGEIYYEAGAEIVVDERLAQNMQQRGIVEIVPDLQPALIKPAEPVRVEPAKKKVKK